MKLTNWAVLGSMLVVLTLALAITVLTAAPVAQAAVTKPKTSGHCNLHYGKGLAETPVPNSGTRGRDYLVDARMGWAIIS
jgi:hypothetical protein